MGKIGHLDEVVRERVGIVMRRMGPRVEVMHDVFTEMDAQVEQWGEQNHHPAYWLAILGKQVGQMGAAILDREWAADPEVGTAKVRHEAIQMVAVGMSMLVCIDSGEMPVGLTTMPQGRQRAKALGLGDEQIDYGADEGEECPTKGCRGDARFGADDPQAGHKDGCTYPHPQEYVQKPDHNHPRGWENCMPGCPMWGGQANVEPVPSDMDSDHAPRNHDTVLSEAFEQLHGRKLND